MFCQKCGTKNPDNGKFCRSCGIDLGGMSEPKGVELKSNQFYVDRKGRIKSNDPDELCSSGIKNIVLGIGFLIISIVLLLTDVAGGRAWWWAMLFPAFSLLAGGIGNYTKSKRLESKKNQALTQNQPSLSTVSQPHSALPPIQTDYINPQKTIYDTGELAAPPSVTEGTTRHLEINTEGETMALPKKEI